MAFCRLDIFKFKNDRGDPRSPKKKIEVDNKKKTKVSAADQTLVPPVSFVEQRPVCPSVFPLVQELERRLEIRTEDFRQQQSAKTTTKKLSRKALGQIKKQQEYERKKALRAVQEKGFPPSMYDASVAADETEAREAAREAASAPTVNACISLVRESPDTPPRKSESVAPHLNAAALLGRF